VDGQRHSPLHNLELIQLVRQVEQLHVDIKIEMISVHLLLDIEDVFGFLV
jgi:hypothetical protein